MSSFLFIQLKINTIKFLIVLMLFTLPTYCFSQKIKTKCNTTRYSKECYSIDKKNKHKIGAYTKIELSSQDTIAKGFFDLGKKRGEWSIFNKKNGKCIVYDFDTDLTIKNNCSLENDSSLIFNNNDYILEKVDINARYIGEDYDLKTTLSSSIVKPILFDSPKNIGRTIVHLKLDENGKIENVDIFQSPTKIVEKLIKKAFIPLVDSWFPAIKDGIPQRSVIIIIIDIENKPPSLPFIDNTYTIHNYIQIAKY